MGGLIGSLLAPSLFAVDRPEKEECERRDETRAVPLPLVACTRRDENSNMVLYCHVPAKLTAVEV